MATATVKAKSKAEGKSGFLKEFFVDHPDANKAAIDEAWRQAGNEGTISDSLISKIRKDLGLTNKDRTRAKASEKLGPGKKTSAPKSGARKTGMTATTNGKHVRGSEGRPAETRMEGEGRTGVLIRIEGQIDEMLHEIKLAVGLPEFEEALRKARRILVRSHEE